VNSTRPTGLVPAVTTTVPGDGSLSGVAVLAVAGVAPLKGTRRVPSVHNETNRRIIVLISDSSQTSTHPVNASVLASVTDYLKASREFGSPQPAPYSDVIRRSYTYLDESHDASAEPNLIG
jgi:hypothetical protein